MLNSLYGVNAAWDYRKNFEAPQQPGQFNHSGAAYRLATADRLMTNWIQAIPVANKSQWLNPLGFNVMVE